MAVVTELVAGTVEVGETAGLESSPPADPQPAQASAPAASSWTTRRRNVIGTYLHGPLLPKNAWLADWLIAHALRLTEPLSPLPDALEQAAHGEARRAAGV